MADYWKSQPRKFCQYCKCWIADNKPSIEFHERGKNHKENVAAKISEIKKKSVEKAKQDARMSKQFAAMEEAALKAYEEDLKRMGKESGSGSGSPVQTTVKPLPLVLPQPLVLTQPVQPVAQKPKIKHQQKKKGKPSKPFRPKQEQQTQVWVEGQTEDGNTYYYNSLTGESQWEKPDRFRGGSSASVTDEQKSSSNGNWMESVSPEGYTYYYNTETGESSWEKPADFPSNEASVSSSEPSQEEENQEQPTTSQSELLTGGEESSNKAQESQQDPVDELSIQMPQISTISFRKRKAEDEPSGKDGEDETNNKTGSGVAQECLEEERQEEKVQSTVTEPEAAKVEKVFVPVKKTKTYNPYGAWEKIRVEEDPYSKVDLQLPQTDTETAIVPADVPAEPKPRFKERIITSLGVEGGPTSFKKTKTQNGKSRSLRQRDNDD